MKTLIFFCLCVSLTHAMLLRKVPMPTELRKVMANVTSLDSFLRALKVERMKTLVEAVKANKIGRKEILLSPPDDLSPVDCVSKEKDLCISDSSCAPGFKCRRTGCVRKCISHMRDLVRMFENSNLPHVILDNAICAPRPEVIEVPQPKNGNAFYFPFFVILHRCGGSCNSFETSCQPQEREDFKLVVGKISWSSASTKLDEISDEVAAVRMTNHSSCSCQCRVKPTDCDNRTHRYSKENCRCDCIARGMPCPVNFQWDPIRCQCICKPTSAARAVCTKRFRFDEKLCRCACSTKRCKQAVKVRDPKTCRCRCPRIRCPLGMRQDPRSCDCIGNIRRVNDERRWN